MIGTVSVRISEQLSGLLTKVGIPHAVLNAKFHQQEAEIVAKAGQLGAVTIATNMAGRGTDIKLGKGVVELGGLHVIGTERHEARRIDRQLRGRCARQGDPGSSHVFVSLEDNLMRLFGSDKLFEFLTLDEGQALTHPIISKAIEQAQKRVERQSFKIRKHTLDYDNVINKQREVIFALRNNVLTTSDFRKLQMDIVEALLDEKLDIATSNPNTTIEFALQDVLSWVCDLTGIQIPIMEIDLNNIEVTKSGILTHINTKYSEFTTKVLETNGNNVADLLALERVKLLYSIDTNWREHLYEMETLRQSTDLRAHGQKDPLTEYKSEAFKMFTNLMNIIKSSICENLVRLTPIRT